jgi:hypothetical protein
MSHYPNFYFTEHDLSVYLGLCQMVHLALKTRKVEAHPERAECITEAQAALPVVGQGKGGASRGDPEDEAVGA